MIPSIFLLPRWTRQRGVSFGFLKFINVIQHFWRWQHRQIYVLIASTKCVYRFSFSDTSEINLSRALLGGNIYIFFILKSFCYVHIFQLTLTERKKYPQINKIGVVCNLQWYAKLHLWLLYHLSTSRLTSLLLITL